MCDVKACRICLTNEYKLYRLDEFNLKCYYDEVMTIKISDNIPQYFCYECAWLLHKFHQFREKCYDGVRALQDMLNRGPITNACLSKVNIRKIYKCQSRSLGMLDTNDHVKTYLLKYTALMNEEISDDFHDGSCNDYIDENLVDNTNDPEIDPIGEDNKLNILEVNLKETSKIENEENPIAESNTVYDVDELQELIVKELLDDLEATTNKKPKVNRSKVVQLKKNKPTSNKQPSKRKVISEQKVTGNKAKETKRKGRARKRMTISPEAVKGYKFNKKRIDFSFLDSVFWKTSTLSEEEAMINFEARAQNEKYLRAMFKCTDCYKGFSKLNMLERHISQRHGEAAGKLSCRFCKMRLKSDCWLRKHMRQHFKKYECLRCDLVCSLEGTALLHEEYHSGVIRKCPHCDKEYKHLSTFYTHLRTHRSKHLCSLCGESFVSELGLRLHRKAKHPTEIETPLKESENIDCDVCKIKFDTHEAYDKHLIHSALHIDLHKSLNDGILRNLLQEKEDDKKCDEDNKTSSELYQRRSTVEKTLCAVRKHKTPTLVRSRMCPSTCHQCGTQFESQSARLKHHHAVHPGTSPFSHRVVCEICGVSLAPSSLPLHLKFHARKKYACATCGRSFSTSLTLKRHQLSHSGERNFECILCGKWFKQECGLRYHNRMVHLKLPYPKRNKTKKSDKPNMELVYEN